jgi:hypothetical protein
MPVLLFKGLWSTVGTSNLVVIICCSDGEATH